MQSISRFTSISRAICAMIMVLFACTVQAEAARTIPTTPIAPTAPTLWKTLAPGLEYTRLGDFSAFPNGYIHAFRIDLDQFVFKIGLTQKTPDLSLNLTDLMHEQNAVIAT